MTFLPIIPELPDGLYRARLEGATDTLFYRQGRWFTRSGYPAATPAEYAPLDRSAAA